MRHFTYFPRINYCNDFAVNIMVRGKIRDLVKSQNTLYYQYTINDSDRPDILAQKYYGNPDYTWAIFYANDIFCPIFEWPLDSTQFNKYLISKYGSVEATQSLTAVHEYLLDEKYIIDEKTFLDINIESSRKRLVTIYDYEFELNEVKRNISILDVKYIRQINNELRQLFTPEGL